MQIYRGGNFVYDFDRQWIFKFGYITKNTRSSQGHRGNNKNNIGKRDISLVKSK